MITPNAYFAVALAGVLIVEGIDTAAEVLNLRRLTADLPPEFSDIYDAETYAKSQR